MTKKNTLLLIDVQNDFHPGGSLAIPSANEDAERIATFISKHSSEISRIVETMDTHHELHIAHSGFWVHGDDHDHDDGDDDDDKTKTNHPNPFTIITSDDIENEKWKPSMENLMITNDDDDNDGISSIDPQIFEKNKDVFDSNGKLDLKTYSAEYARQLEATGRFQLIIWPDHCIIGTEGHNVVPCVRKEMTKWVKTTGNSIEWVHKGQNLFTEMYSVFKAEVAITKSTSFNHKLLKSLLSSDRVIIAGQALSHCVNFTVRDIVANWPKNDMHKIHILTDCCSSVPGYEETGKKFLDDMKEAGVTLCTSEDAFEKKKKKGFSSLFSSK